MKGFLWNWPPWFRQRASPSQPSAGFEVKRTRAAILVVSLICVPRAAGARWSCVWNKTGYRSERTGSKLGLSLDTNPSALPWGWPSWLCSQNVGNPYHSQAWLWRAGPGVLAWCVITLFSVEGKENQRLKTVSKKCQTIGQKLKISLKFSFLLSVFKVRLPDDVTQNSPTSFPLVSSIQKSSLSPVRYHPFGALL